MLNKFEWVILNDSNGYIHHPEGLPKHILDVPYELKVTSLYERFRVNTKKKIKISDKEYNLTEIWPMPSAGRIFSIIPFRDGNPPDSSLEFNLGREVKLFNSGYAQLNFAFPLNGNNFYSIHFFPQGKIEELKKALQNLKNLEEFF